MAKETIGVRLRYLRKQTNRTQEEVAKRVELSRAAYSHFENDRNEPDATTILRLADYFGVTTDYILGHKVNDNHRVAAHEDPDLSPEQQKEIDEYIEFKKAQYRKDHQKKKD